MKRQRGFTLVELLAVIVILGIILSISTVAIVNIKEKQDAKNYENTISSILTGAKAYNVDNKISIGSSISVETLLEKGYVDFNQKKYSDLVSEIVEKKSCADEGTPLKVKYVLDGYNDCGCEEQKVETAKELCP